MTAPSEPGVAAAGRWPANVILTDPIFDGGWDGVVGGGDAGGGFGVRGHREPRPGRKNKHDDWGMYEVGQVVGYGDTGTYSRFFLIPKASRSDREPLVAGELELGDVFRNHHADNPKCRACGRQRIGALGAPSCDCDEPEWAPVGDKQRRNTHPTVKPVELMRHLVRLVTPQGGTVLDPFLGSGSTAIAAEQEGFDWIGIEREAEYVAIAKQRMVDVQSGLGLDVPAPVTVRAQSNGKPGWNGLSRKGGPEVSDILSRSRSKPKDELCPCRPGDEHRKHEPVKDGYDGKAYCHVDLVPWPCATAADLGL
jgi:hypothetical protein